MLQKREKNIPIIECLNQQKLLGITGQVEEVVICLSVSCHNKILTGWLKKQKFIFSQLWWLVVWDQNATWLVSCENSPPNLHADTFSQCPYMTEGLGKEGDRRERGGGERSWKVDWSLILLLLRALIPSWGPHPKDLF